MTKLSVNINKIATIRNARGGNVPDVRLAAINCQRFGADGITVHPRPDERHIKYRDVYEIKPVITTEFNVEGFPSEDFMKLVTSVKPDQVTLVPDLPSAITSNMGWDTVSNRSFLKDVVEMLRASGIRSSIFVDPEIEKIENALRTGADRIELYTEPYAKYYTADRNKAVEPYVAAARFATEAGLELNAGHDLNLENLKFFHQNIPWLKEVSIGHALVSDALYYGLENTINMYKRLLRD